MVLNDNKHIVSEVNALLINICDGITNDISAFCDANKIPLESFYFAVYKYTYFKFKGDLSFIDEESEIVNFINNININENEYNDIQIIDKMSFSHVLYNVASSFTKCKYLKNVEFVTKDDEKIYDKLNDTDTKEEINETVIDVFKDNVRKYPNNICIVYGNIKYTYKEIDNITDAFAYALLENGVKKNDVISVLVDSSIHKFLSTIGILKIGAAYQPNDIMYPDDRIKYIIKDSGAKFVIVDEYKKQFVSKNNIDYLDVYDLLKVECKDIKKVRENKPSIDDLFTIIYTSGSTGNPKGVMLSHKNVSYFCNEYIKYHKMDNESKFAAYNSYTFVVHIEEYFTTMLSLGTIYFVPREIRKDVKYISAFYDDNKITNAHLPSQLANIFIKNMHPKTLKRLVIGGEAVKPCIPPKEYKIFNSYGPTECTIKVANFLIDNKYDNTPIGKAIDNIKLYVVDKYFRRMPFLFPGEILVSGPQVALGYKNISENHSFISNPFNSDIKYKNAYATGDIGRYLEDGNLEYLGRNDNQVKIRGYRVELNEIEFVLREYYSVKDATVNICKDSSENNYLAAYLVSDEKLDINDVKNFLAIKLPLYMVPAIIMQIDSIPYNDHGKVNKKALPIPVNAIKEIVNPKTDIEKTLYDIISKVTNKYDFGVTTDLYDIGINSIDIMNIIIFISNEYNIDINFNELFNAKTIINLSQIIIDKKNLVKNETIINEYPLTRLQKWIVDLCLNNKDNTICNLAHLYRLPKEIDLDKLENAIKKVWDIHPGLKAIFKINNGKYILDRDDKRQVNIRRIKTDKLPEKNKLVYPYSILNNELYRITIYECNDSNYLFVDIAHAITDGDSNMILRIDTESAYLGLNLPKEKYTSFDYALEESNHIFSDEYNKIKEYYKKVYHNFNNTKLPKFDSTEKDTSPNTISIFSDIYVDEVKEFCKKINVTENAFYLAVFGYMLTEMSHENTGMFLTIYNGRNSTKYNNTVGLMMKIFIIFVKYTNDMSIKEYIILVQKMCLLFMLHDLYAYEDISRDLNLYSDILFLFYGDRYPENRLKFADFDVEEIPIHFLPPTKLSFLLKYIDNKVLLQSIYYKNLYKYETIEKISKRYIEIIKLFLNKKNIYEIKR